MSGLNYSKFLLTFSICISKNIYNNLNQWFLITIFNSKKNKKYFLSSNLLVNVTNSKGKVRH